MITIGSLSTAFATTLYVHPTFNANISLYLHRSTSQSDSDRRSLLRALEVGSAVSLFLLWPRMSLTTVARGWLMDSGGNIFHTLPIDPESSV